MTEQIAKKQPQADQESQWSLSSLQQLKGLDLNQIKDQQDRDEFPRQQATQQKQKIQPKFPPAQQLTPQCKFYPVGKIIQKAGQLLIIEANNCNNLVDLDNWLFFAINTDQKQCLGFVIDIFGRVDHPYYAIKMLEEVEKKITYWGQIIGIQLYYAEGCKTLNEGDIRSIKEKSSAHKQAQQNISQSSDEAQLPELNEQQQLDQKSNTIMRDKEHHNFGRRRKASFQQQAYYRERTREKKNFRRFDNDDNNSNNMQNRHFSNNSNYRRENNNRHHNVQHRNPARERQQNQQYLESMYSKYYTQMMQLYNGQNGMPMPMPPVFPMVNTNQQQTVMQFNQMPQNSQMPPIPYQQSMQMPLLSTPMPFFPNTQNSMFPNMYQPNNNAQSNNNIFTQQQPFSQPFSQNKPQ